MKRKDNNTVSVEEQEAMGLRRPRQPGFVVPETKPTVVRRMLPTENRTEHVINVPPSATQVVEMRTSAVDRAKGHLIATVPLFVFVGFVVDLLVYQFADYPLLSIPSVLILTGATVLCWFASWIYTLSISAEAVSKYEARRKWDVVDREQKNRWRYYDRED